MIRRMDEVTPERAAAEKGRITGLGYRVGPLVACGVRDQELQKQARIWGFEEAGRVELGGCRLYRY